MQGRTDIDLDDHGRAQSDVAGRRLARSVWARIVSSPMSRAQETARIIATHLPGAEQLVRLDLRERDYGEAEGIPVAQAHERWPDGDYPGAEPLAAVVQRASAVLTDLMVLPGNTVVVAHGTLLRAAVEALTGAPCPRILNGEIVVLEPGGGADGRAQLRGLMG